ncbi:hypothetical protein D5S17_32010 [Pseudonocardiaceae bacterium YIM PH 21723]|nr:hypothetical protein D5S17_32010 [Pseudonocardiaceae bacterium YIM PH 21723]
MAAKPNRAVTGTVFGVMAAGTMLGVITPAAHAEAAPVAVDQVDAPPSTPSKGKQVGSFVGGLGIGSVSAFGARLINDNLLVDSAPILDPAAVQEKAGILGKKTGSTVGGTLGGLLTGHIRPGKHAIPDDAIEAVAPESSGRHAAPEAPGRHAAAEAPVDDFLSPRLDLKGQVFGQQLGKEIGTEVGSTLGSTASSAIADAMLPGSGAIAGKIGGLVGKEAGAFIGPRVGGMAGEGAGMIADGMLELGHNEVQKIKARRG